MIPAIESSTPEERRQFINKTFPCIHNCDLCRLCYVFEWRTAELAFADYIEGICSFSEVAKRYSHRR